MVKPTYKKWLTKVRTALRKYSSLAPFTSGVLLGLLVVYVAAVVGLVALVEAVTEGELFFDQLAMNWVKNWHSPGVTLFLTVVTEMGGVIGVGIGTAVAVAGYWLTRHNKAALLLLFSVAGAVVINLTLKGIFQRERPNFWEHFVQESGYSFPSGHAMASAALAIALIFLLWRTKARWWVVGVGLSYMLLVGISRMYLGVHYPTDIVAGWCVSFIWVSIVAMVLYEYSVLRRHTKKR